MNWTHYDHKDPIQAQEDMHEKIKENQLKLGWITLPSLNTNKDINVITDKKKYKLIRTEYIKNKTLLKILKTELYSLYYDVDSISKISRDSNKVFKIKILITANTYETNYLAYMIRKTILSNYEISCFSNNRIKLVSEMWWNGKWFNGIGYTWRDQASQIRNSFPEVIYAKDYKWMEVYNNLLCDVVNNKNEIKASKWKKNKEKRKAKLKEEKERKVRKAKEEKERKAKKAKEERRKLDVDKAVKTCLDLGFKKGTKKYKNCIIEIL